MTTTPDPRVAALEALMPPDDFIDSTGDYEMLEVCFRFEGYRWREFRAALATPTVESAEPTGLPAPEASVGHRYSPDAMAMGDCKVCGHVYEDHHPGLATPPAPEACQHKDIDHGHGVPPYCKDCGKQIPRGWMPTIIVPPVPEAADPVQNEMARAKKRLHAPEAAVERCACGHGRDKHAPDTCRSCDGLDGPMTGKCAGFAPMPAPTPPAPTEAAEALRANKYRAQRDALRKEVRRKDRALQALRLQRAAARAPLTVDRDRLRELATEARLVSQWYDAVDLMPTELRAELDDLGQHAAAILAALEEQR